MAGYTPLFNSIVRSSIWDEDNVTRIVWITMLALADADGTVESSLPGLAHEARVSLSECKTALAILKAPDPHSRTMEQEGRRIREIEGGWLVLNHKLYRQKAKSRAGYYRQWRQAQKEKTSPVNPLKEKTNSNSNSNRRNRAQQAQHVARKFIPPTIEEIQAYLDENPDLDELTAEEFFKDYSPDWVDTQGKPVRNWKLKLRTRNKYGKQNAGTQRKSTRQRKEPERDFDGQHSDIGETINVD